MNRLPFERWSPRAPASYSAASGPATALLITCIEECFPAAALARELLPNAWTIQRAPANIIPPFGAGHQVEEDIIEQAIAEQGVDTVVVCGHHPCRCAAYLLDGNGPADDFVLRDWLTHAAAAQRAAAGGSLRDLAAHNVLAQIANLRTHPAVAAALAQGRLRLWPWLYDGELLYSAPGQTTFDRPAALHAEQNRHLRRRRPQLRSTLPSLQYPYLA